MRKLIRRVPFVWRELTKRVLVSVINFPIISRVYNRLYQAVIRKKASAIHGFSKIDIETYNVCNLRCLMCPYPDMTREKVLMSMELFQKIIDDATSSGIKNVGLHMYSEPLLDPLLFERIRYAKSKGMRVEFSSNGALLTKDKIDAILDSGLDEIGFSLDAAIKETYERLRCGANFQKTRGNIIQLIKERNKRRLTKPFIQVNFAYQMDNLKELKEFELFWKKLADSVAVWRVDARGKEGLLPTELEIKGKQGYPCLRIFNECEVISNGKVVLCCLDYDGSTIIGDLNKQALAEVWNSATFRRVKELHLTRQGDKIKLCRSLHCDQMYINGAYGWWHNW